MTRNPKSKQATMFDMLAKKNEKRSRPNDSEPSVADIAADLKAEQEPPADVTLDSIKQRRTRSKSGKRSDPRYTQVGCYLPIELNNRVKIKLVADPRDFSDLVAELLDNWLID